MSEPRIVNIIEFLDRSSRVINLKIRLRMTDSDSDLFYFVSIQHSVTVMYIKIMK